MGCWGNPRPEHAGSSSSKGRYYSHRTGTTIGYGCKYNKSVTVTTTCFANRTWSALSGECPPPSGCLEAPLRPPRVISDTYSVSSLSLLCIYELSFFSKRSFPTQSGEVVTMKCSDNATQLIVECDQDGNWMEVQGSCPLVCHEAPVRPPKVISDTFKVSLQNCFG